LPKPDIVLGDFNITEDAINRSPPKLNERTATEALRDLRTKWGVQDQWWHDNPNGRAFTHTHVRGENHEFVRLDRIYAARKHERNLFNWEMKLAAVPTNHWLVTVKLALKDTPTIGQGQWTCPIKAVNDQETLKLISETGMKVQEEIENAANTPTAIRTKSPQILWSEFKKDIKKIVRK
ncbi:hypothetical protein BJV74DRAFT_751997, partial [Russula compacta]